MNKETQKIITEIVVIFTITFSAIMGIIILGLILYGVTDAFIERDSNLIKDDMINFWKNLRVGVLISIVISFIVSALMGIDW